jgi:AcrR family transcriptional regulator
MTSVTSSADELTLRVLDGARESVARWGVRRTGVDDVARQAGLSRASVYRAFPGGKSAVLAGLVDDERERLTTVIAAAERPDLEATLVALVNSLSRWFDDNRALRHVIEHETDVIGPYLSFSSGDRVLGDVIGLVRPLLSAHLDPADVDGAADYVTRMLRSHLFAPSSHVALSDPTSVRRLVQTFLMPALQRVEQSSARGSTKEVTL